MAQKKRQDVFEKAMKLHKKMQGKIEVCGKASITKQTLPLLYTPGVAHVASLCAEHPEMKGVHTWTGRTIAVVSDGSAVLGLGAIGPHGALPVMEGKALLFKELGGVNAIPIVLDVHDVPSIVSAVQAIAPSFGGINLEDIAAPKCFAIEEELVRTLTIPVLHDDQHATAIVVLAGLINAHKVVKKNIVRSRIAIIGAGAAGTAIAKLLVRFGVGDVLVVDSQGLLCTNRISLTKEKEFLAQHTNKEGRCGSVLEAVVGADAVIGVSGPRSILPEHVRVMAQKPIVFALANPVPEITPEEAYKAGAWVVATGRSDFPNQINNVLAFPGIFRGALAHNVRFITDDIKLAVAKKLAGLVKNPTRQCIVPSVFDKSVASAVAHVVR